MMMITNHYSSKPCLLKQFPDLFAVAGDLSIFILFHLVVVATLYSGCGDDVIVGGIGRCLRAGVGRRSWKLEFRVSRGTL